jgi:hypothetical protein
MDLTPSDDDPTRRHAKAGSRFPATVEIQIEELVLRGFAPGDRYRIGEAVEQELARLITERGIAGMAGCSVSIERLDAGAFPVAAGARAQRVGMQVAQKVYSQLSRSVQKPPENRRLRSQ